MSKAKAKQNSAKKHASITRCVNSSLEQRSDLRINVKQKVICKSHKEFRELYISNISKGGIFLETAYPPEIGSLIKLGLHIPGSNDEIELIGRVVQHQQTGAGIQFLDLDREQIRSLEKYIAQNSSEVHGRELFAGTLLHVFHDPAVYCGARSMCRDLSHCSLPVLLHEVHERRITGILRIFHPNEGFRTIRFHEGHPTEITSSCFNENYCLGRLLRKAGKISTEILKASLRKIVQTGKKQGQLLVEDGHLSVDEVRRGLEWQLELRLNEILEWTQAEFIMHETDDDRKDRSTIHPELDTQQVVFRNVYRQARQHPDIMLERLCNYHDFNVVFQSRLLKTHDNVRLFTNTEETHLWHHIIHRSPTLNELAEVEDWPTVQLEAFAFALAAAGMVRFEHSNWEVVDSASEYLQYLVDSKNYFQMLNVPWTTADPKLIEQARDMQVMFLADEQLDNEEHLRELINEAYHILSNDFQRRDHRKQLISEAERKLMASRLYRLGKLKFGQGNYERAQPLFASAADLNPAMAEYSHWLERSIKHQSSQRSKKSA